MPTMNANVSRWLRVHLLPALILLFGVDQAHAGIEACYDLSTAFKPNDVSLAYQFAKDHGECIANFENPAFQAVAGSLTSLTLSGALKPGQCSSIMGNVNSPAAQQLLKAADVGVVGAYLNCGCAVADSGIADKIKTLVQDAVSCAKTFDPTGPIYSGMEKAGDALGFSTLWGMESNDHNANAGVGNGGAPTSAYAAPTCTVKGIPITSWSKAWDGSALPVGQHVQSCQCPPPTQVYADFKMQPGNDGIAFGTFHSPTFLCMTCPPNSAKDSYGNCSICENKSGPNGFEIWAPNQDGSACAFVNVVTLPQDQATMDAAAAAGCPNNGNVASIHCDSDTAWAACVNALPAQKGACQIDFIAASRANAKLIFDAATTADSPCELNDREIACTHPIQQGHCATAKQGISDAWGPNSLLGVHCEPLESPEYEQMKQTAQQVVLALNAEYPPNPAPASGCWLHRNDPLLIICDDGFGFDAIPERAATVYALLNAVDATGRPRSIFCLGDVDHDGAETPCIQGQESDDLPPPVMQQAPVRQTQPIIPQRAPAPRLRRVPIIKTDGGGG
jgi:hypothetical protein